MFDKLPSFPLNFSAFSPSDGDVSTIWGTRLLPVSKSDEVLVAADGSGHFTTIQEALTFIGAGSGTIRIKDGEYPITTGMTIPASVTIVGSGYGTHIYTTADITIFTSTGARVQLDSLRIAGNNTGTSQRGINFSGARCSIRNCYIENFGDWGISITGNSNLVVNNWIENCDDECLKCEGDYCVLNGNYINDSAGTGIQLTSSVGTAIVGNMTTNHGDHGIDLISSSQCLVQGNYSFSNGDNNANGAGININAGNDNCINGNVFHTNDGHGITIASGTKNVLIGNSCLNNEDGAISDSGTSTFYRTATDTDPLNVVA